jgi:hypothetical protein
VGVGDDREAVPRPQVAQEAAEPGQRAYRGRPLGQVDPFELGDVAGGAGPVEEVGGGVSRWSIALRRSYEVKSASRPWTKAA